jgi:hypothetical protein
VLALVVAGAVGCGGAAASAQQSQEPTPAEMRAQTTPAGPILTGVVAFVRRREGARPGDTSVRQYHEAERALIASVPLTPTS